MIQPASSPTSRSTPGINQDIAARFEEVADLLEAHGTDRFRVAAYRNGAETIRTLTKPVDQLLAAEGTAGLMRLSAIGRSLARAVDQFVRTGRLPLLKQLRGEDVSERQFATVADIGPQLAHRIHAHLRIESLAELEAAANDGRLAEVPGMGRKRIRAVRESLAGRFRGNRQSEISTRHDGAAPNIDVAELLDVDAQYRRQAKANKLPRIAPLQFNPGREAWLPVLHTHRGDRHYTALYSNTARAHALGATGDWVVIYRDDRNNHGGWTVITSQYGKLRGRRIVRGREPDCREYYASQLFDPLYD